MASEAVNDFAQDRNGLGALYFCDQQTLATRCMHQFACQLHVVRRTREGHRQKIRLDQRGSLDVFLVLVSQRGCGESATLAVDTLVVGQHAAAHNHAMHFCALDAGDVKFQHAVVEQQYRADIYILGQFLVIQPDALLVAKTFQRSIENESIALVQGDFVVLEFAHANLRTLQVGQDTDSAACGFGCGAHLLGAAHVILCRTM